MIIRSVYKLFWTENFLSYSNFWSEIQNWLRNSKKIKFFKENGIATDLTICYVILVKHKDIKVVSDGNKVAVIDFI